MPKTKPRVSKSSLRSLPLKDILSVRWKDFIDKPIIHPPFPDFLLADPVLLAPHESPGGKWHLFAHGAFGMYHYMSEDGISWGKRPKFLGWFMLRPCIYKERGLYYLFYEQMSHVHKFPFYNSRMEYKTSKDLVHWSKPTTVIVPSKAWHKTLNTIGNAGSAWIIKINGQYRLYYSSGLIYLPECKFCEPKNISYATSDKISGPYTLHDEHITFNVYKKTKYTTRLTKTKPYMWPPSVRVFKAKDGYLGLVTMYSLDETLKKSRADLRLATSKDGIAWKHKSPKPIISPDRPWKKSHVYVGHLARVGRELRIYHNVRNGWLIGREAIALSITSLGRRKAL